MGKRYFCDYCERSFADNADNRKKHLASVNHQKLRKSHYQMFRDAATVLREEACKNPCRRFNQTGYCDYGAGCKYSHLTAEDITALQKQVKFEEEQSQKRAKVELPDPDIKGWLENVMKKQDKSLRSLASCSDNSRTSLLPEALRNIPNLPPSLIPSKPADLLQKNVSEWG